MTASVSVYRGKTPPLTPPQGRGTFLGAVFRGVRPEKPHYPGVPFRAGRGKPNGLRQAQASLPG